MVIFGGRAQVVSGLAERCAAVIQAWYPGEEGGNAVADILYGKVSPSAKLSVSYPNVEINEPICYNYKAEKDPRVAWPFGYGLSYTTFEIGDATIDGKEGNYQVTIPVSNTGQKDGTEIVQLYIRDLADKEGPLKSLRGFQRVDVKVGQTAKATITLDKKSFEFWDAATNTMRTKSGQYEILYGSSSLDKDLKRLSVKF